MDISTVAILTLLFVAVVLLAWILVRVGRSARGDSGDTLHSALELLRAELTARQSESLLTLRDSMDKASQIINERLAEGSSSLDRRMAVLGDIEHRLGKLSTQTDNIEAIGKNIQSLADLLKPPKLRGNLGEILLENLLGEILPSAMFETQYTFDNGSRVDAIVKLGDRLLPIDAKFPVEAYDRVAKNPDDVSLQKEFSKSLKRHIDAIADKYIQPTQQTTEFALMYIPAEAVYYQLIAQEHREGFDYALSRRVIPSSPGHLYAFLASVATTHAEIALSRGEIARDSRLLLDGLNSLGEISERVGKYHERMEGSLRALLSGFERARTEMTELRRQLEKLRDPFATADEKMEADA